MTRYLLLILTLLYCSTRATGQTTAQLTGVLVDSVSGKPISYATAGLLKDAQRLKTAQTDSAGRFIFRDLGAGKYTLSAAAVGYKERSLGVAVSGTTNLPAVKLQPATANLGEVAVTGSRPVIKQESDRITYDVQADAESKTLTVLDMMRKVPLLAVDADDNIRLKGSGNFKILINNRPSGMVTRDPKEVLRNMPASSIQKIEVITTPPSRFDAEGLSGIINIITTKKVDNGYNGSLSLRNQWPGGPGANMNLTWKQGKFGVDLSGGTGVWKVAGVQVRENRSTTGAAISSLASSGENSIDNKWLWGAAVLSYELDSLNLFTAEINPYTGYNEQTMNQRFNLVNGGATSAYKTDNIRRFDWGGTDYTFNYQRGFNNNKNHLLTLSYKYFGSKEPSTGVVSFYDRQNFTGPDYRQQNKNTFREQTAQADYVVPAGKVTVEAGLKAILRKGSAEFDSYNLNPATGLYELQLNRTDGYSNEQQILGAYTSAALTLDKWSLKGGARLESTRVEGLFASASEAVKQQYINLIPTVSFSRKFEGGHNMSLGFTQRIERPAIYRLNPFVDRSRPNLEQSGNPDLEAVLSNNFELGYSVSKKGSVNLGLSYNFANNTQQTVIRYDPATNISRITYLNIGRDRSLGSNVNINYPISSKWSLNMNGSLNYIWLEGTIAGAPTQNSGLTGYISANTGYKFEHTWKANVSFNYGAPEVLLQGSSNNYYFFSLSGSKDLIKDKLTLSASAANPFQKYRAYANFITGSDFTQNYYRENYFRRISASLVWKFGKFEGSIRKNQRTIRNDDVKSQSAG